MKKIYIPLLLTILFLNACKEEKEKPKVIYDPKQEKAEVKIDSTEIEIADLPIIFGGTKVLISPIGYIKFYDKNKTYSSDNYQEINYKVSNFNENEITGYLTNLKFQTIGLDTITKLTDKKVMIQTVSYLKTVADRTKQQILVYTLADNDTNKDGNIDGSDIKTLYISDINGQNFRKLSTDFEELIDWNLIEETNTIYFRTIEDTNKNGAFDDKDIIHYQKLKLNEKDSKIEFYKPI